MKVVLDTNIWLSAIFWEGEANNLLRLIEKKKIKILISEEIINEIIEVLNKEAKFQDFIQEREQKIEDLIRTILSLSDLIETNLKIDEITEDPSDNMFLEVAVEGKADYIISYNDHLLDLKKFKGIKIVLPSEFLKEIK